MSKKLFYNNLYKFLFTTFYDKSVSTESVSSVSGLDISYFFVSNGYTALLYGTSCVGAGWSKLSFYLERKDI